MNTQQKLAAITAHYNLRPLQQRLADVDLTGFIDNPYIDPFHVVKIDFWYDRWILGIN